MSEDLKPCPFCGGEDLASGGDDKFVGYWCNNCQAQGPNHYGGSQWNTRTDATKDAEIARLREALTDLLDVYSKPDDRLCCDGRDCGCMGATVHQQAEYYARAALSPIPDPAGGMPVEVET